MDESRRRYLQTAAGIANLGLAGCSATPDGATITDSPTASVTHAGTSTSTAAPTSNDDGLPVQLHPVATGLKTPLGIEFPPGVPDHQYIVTQPGQILVQTPEGLADTPFLDISEATDVGGEKGLLGLAFHPNFTDNRRFYVRYSSPPRDGTPSSYSHTFVLAEFQAADDGLTTTPGSERVLLEIPQPQSNHNAGALVFGPDDYLYIGVGDGGGANDMGPGHADDWYAGTPGGNGQDVTANLLGSILRIDVDSESSESAYGIPESNPLVGQEGRDEHYAWGLRNPWRMSFTGDEFFVADVGQNRFEEINLVEAGGNYGWNIREGTQCFNPDASDAGTDCPTVTPEGDRLQAPIIEYPHTGSGPTGISVIGGYLYHGDAIPGLRDKYVFGDLRPNGQLFIATRSDEGPWPITATTVANPKQLNSIYSFGRDNEDELYLLDGRAGNVYKLRPS